jgi:hypothetical protein
VLTMVVRRVVLSAVVRSKEGRWMVVDKEPVAEE